MQKEASEADWEIASMDDEQKFGPVLHRLTFAEAIDQDLLSDYQVVVVGVTDASYREMAQRGGVRHAPTARRSPTPARSPANSASCGRCGTTTCAGSSRFHSRIANARSASPRSLPEVTRLDARPPPPSGELCGRSTSRAR